MCFEIPNLNCVRACDGIISTAAKEMFSRLGTPIASYPAMTDEKYVTLLLWTICVLTFACGVVAITQHPEWFGA